MLQEIHKMLCQYQSKGMIELPGTLQSLEKCNSEKNLDKECEQRPSRSTNSIIGKNYNQQRLTDHFDGNSTSKNLNNKERNEIERNYNKPTALTNNSPSQVSFCNFSYLHIALAP